MSNWRKLPQGAAVAAMPLAPVQPNSPVGLSGMKPDFSSVRLRPRYVEARILGARMATQDRPLQQVHGGGNDFVSGQRCTPPSASFDRQGNLLVVEWVEMARAGKRGGLRD